MFNLFKRAAVYTIMSPYVIDKDRINELLADRQFTQCRANERTRVGWRRLVDGGDKYCYTSGENVLLVLRQEKKILPNDVITTHVKAEIARLEDEQSRKISKSEKITVKEQILASLLPRALTRTTDTQIWIDMKQNRVIIDAGSARQAEEILAFLRTTLGSLPVMPLQTKENPSVIMTEWISAGHAPPPFNFSELTTARMNSAFESSASITFRNEAVGSDAIDASVRDGNFADTLVVNHHIDFSVSVTISSDLIIKNIAFSDIFISANKDTEAADQESQDIAKQEADFMLMCGVLSRVIDDMITVFGGERGLEK